MWGWDERSGNVIKWDVTHEGWAKVNNGRKWKCMRFKGYDVECQLCRFKEPKINMQTKWRQLTVTLWKRCELIFIIKCVIKQKWLSTTTTSTAIMIWILCHAEEYEQRWTMDKKIGQPWRNRSYSHRIINRHANSQMADRRSYLR